MRFWAAICRYFAMWIAFERVRIQSPDVAGLGRLLALLDEYFDGEKLRSEAPSVYEVPGRVGLRVRVPWDVFSSGFEGAFQNLPGLSEAFFRRSTAYGSAIARANLKQNSTVHADKGNPA